jgi:hypothetical protein
MWARIRPQFIDLPAASKSSAVYDRPYAQRQDAPASDLSGLPGPPGLAKRSAAARPQLGMMNLIERTIPTLRSAAAGQNITVTLWPQRLGPPEDKDPISSKMAPYYHSEGRNVPRSIFWPYGIVRITGFVDTSRPHDTKDAQHPRRNEAIQEGGISADAYLMTATHCFHCQRRTCSRTSHPIRFTIIRENGQIIARRVSDQSQALTTSQNLWGSWTATQAVELFWQGFVDLAEFLDCRPDCSGSKLLPFT